VYAHRGGALLRPENTILAFDHGLSLGADGLELDVHLSRDGVVVVHHDALLDRTTGARGPLADRTADELARVDAGYWFTEVRLKADGGVRVKADATGTGVRLKADGGVRLKADATGTGGRPKADAAGGDEYPFRGQGIGIPRLSEVLTRYPATPLIIELKVNRPELAERVLEEVRRAGAVDRVAFGSFGWRVLHTARAREPGIPTGASQEEVRWALYRSWVRWPLGRPRYRELQVPEQAGSTRVVTPRFIEHAHRAGVLVKVWTVDDPADMRRLLQWGVDALISDRPDLAAPIVTAFRTGNSPA
jgi:glycerophosphoryl diester phosphodiesterase